MAGLLDFLQSASNAAASNVTGPVDGIAWLLRKAGIDVGEPVGGSDWAKRKGLMRDVPQSGASLAGETAGLLGPIAVAAKAPQIARGLLQAGENLAAPRTMNPELGAIVWHGSPHKFDKFDASKIGTGEGAQAYGHGLYLADSKDVAASYAKNTTYTTTINGKPLTPDHPQFGAASEIAARGFDKALADAKSALANGFVNPQYGAAHVSAIESLKGAKIKQTMNDSLYKVDLPDDKIARMLDWDKPLSQQAPEVRKVLAKFDQDSYHPSGGDYDANEMGQQIYNRLAGVLNVRNPGPQNASVKVSDYLRQQGIPGIRYLDGGSRGAGAGTSNYVVFPGEENILTILERNGIPIR